MGALRSLPDGSNRLLSGGNGDDAVCLHDLDAAYGGPCVPPTREYRGHSTRLRRADLQPQRPSRVVSRTFADACQSFARPGAPSRSSLALQAPGTKMASIAVAAAAPAAAGLTFQLPSPLSCAAAAMRFAPAAALPPKPFCTAWRGFDTSATPLARVTIERALDPGMSDAMQRSIAAMADDAAPSRFIAWWTDESGHVCVATRHPPPRRVRPHGYRGRAMQLHISMDSLAAIPMPRKLASLLSATELEGVKAVARSAAGAALRHGDHGTDEKPTPLATVRRVSEPGAAAPFAPAVQPKPAPVLPPSLVDAYAGTSESASQRPLCLPQCRREVWRSLSCVRVCAGTAAGPSTHYSRAEGERVGTAPVGPRCIRSLRPLLLVGAHVQVLLPRSRYWRHSVSPPSRAQRSPSP